jgi:hypothetical protein
METIPFKPNSPNDKVMVEPILGGDMMKNIPSFSYICHFENGERKKFSTLEEILHESLIEPKTYEYVKDQISKVFDMANQQTNTNSVEAFQNKDNSAADITPLILATLSLGILGYVVFFMKQK